MAIAMSAGRIVRGNSIIDCGFDASGGFYVLDHLLQVAAYAYPSSAHADLAKRSPLAAVTRMLNESERGHVSKAIRLSHYHAVCRTSGR